MNEYKKNLIEKTLHNPQDGKVIDLSQETLSHSDYLWLANIIKESSFVEAIKLPMIARDKTNDILLILNEATTKNSTLTMLDINLSAHGKKIPENISLLYRQIQSRVQRNSKQIFAIHGGGNIGLGLMADILARGPHHYDVIATSNNQLIRDLVNSNNKFWLQHGTDSNATTCVKNIRLVSREKKSIIKLYKDACLAAICLTPDAMSNVASEIAEALIERYQIDGSGLKILVLMNIPHCDKVVYDKISIAMTSITKNETYTKKILSGIEFVPTVIDRIVIPIKPEKIFTQLKLQLANRWSGNKTEIDHLLRSTDKLGKTALDLDLQFNLFNAELNFSMHVLLPFLKHIVYLQSI